MTKNLKVLAAGLALACLAGQAQARITAPSPTAATVGGDVDDKWCVGKSSGAELCVDGQSNFVPIQNELLNIGSDTLRFKAVYASSFNATGDFRTSGNLVVNGNTTLGDAPQDTLDLNVTTVTINSGNPGLKIGTSTTDGTYILTVDGSSRSIGINDHSPESSLKIVPLNASTTGQIIAGATSQTADLLQFTNASASTMTRVGPNGHWGLRRYQKAAIDTLVPDFLGALIQCSDCTAPYTVCGGTGAVVAGNWQNIASSASLMGVGQAKAGCGTGE